MKLKDTTGWFAASHRMLRALGLLSDGAFKLFTYLCLTADRNTGRVEVPQTQLARALGKSRNSIRSYLEELSYKGVCLIRFAANQHQSGEIEIADDFWPYQKMSERSLIESRYVEQVRSWLKQYQIFRSSFGAADQKLAAHLFNQGVSLKRLERALLLGLTRKYIACLNSTAPTPIYSIRYFFPLLEEVAQTEASDQYWEYLRRRLKDLDSAWRDQRGASDNGRVSRQTLSNSTISQRRQVAV